MVPRHVTRVFLTAVPVLVLGLPAALTMKNLPLRGEHRGEGHQDHETAAAEES
ncbi:hypothetical protein GCM10010234_47530 [Streptomyces hawaiiensis]|uniref:hypothetical protein n=1 Tax=Streptomyces hawaiiensis TaxID=67305 RepID=UPI0031E14265